MKKILFKNYLLKSPLKLLLLIFFIFVLGMNYVNLSEEIQLLSKIQRIQGHQKIGKKFYGLDNAFKNIKYVGYYTDKDLKDPENNKQVSEAQYVIAPTIVDINNTDHEFILFDCTSENIALEKIEEINATIIQKHLGIILARKNK